MPFFAFIPSTSTDKHAPAGVSIPTRQQRRPHKKVPSLQELEKITDHPHMSTDDDHGDHPCDE